MIRINLFIKEEMQKDLQYLAAQEGKNIPLAKVVRDILTEGIAKKKALDLSGKKTMETLLAMHITGGDDPYLSENIDHYLYGAPKKRR